MKTYAYGFPRLGKNREFKKIVEAFWKKEASESDTRKALDHLQEEILSTYQREVDLFPLGEITAYDPMFDTAIMAGLYRPEDLDEYYELCRGKDALEMTKWFNTNYHYLVTDFSRLGNIRFELQWNKPRAYLDKFSITIEATGTDHLGCYGYGRKTSPNIDKIAKEGVLFTNMFVPRASTGPSLTSLLTSFYVTYVP